MNIYRRLNETNVVRFWETVGSSKIDINKDIYVLQDSKIDVLDIDYSGLPRLNLPLQEGTLNLLRVVDNNFIYYHPGLNEDGIRFFSELGLRGEFEVNPKLLIPGLRESFDLQVCIYKGMLCVYWFIGFTSYDIKNVLNILKIKDIDKDINFNELQKYSPVDLKIKNKDGDVVFEFVFNEEDKSISLESKLEGYKISDILSLEYLNNILDS